MVAWSISAWNSERMVPDTLPSNTRRLHTRSRLPVFLARRHLLGETDRHGCRADFFTRRSQLVPSFP